MNAITRTQDAADVMEQVVIGGDLKALTASQRVTYYQRVCDSVGLNWLTKPFEYITLNGKLTLYARRDAADQLRRINGISLGKPNIQYADDLVIVTIDAVDKQGRTDQDMGAVSTQGLKGEAKANAMMKAITKAKRRVTLSISGLGWLDETEVDSIDGAQRVVVADTGEIVQSTATVLPHANGKHAPAIADPVDVSDHPNGSEFNTLAADQTTKLHAIGKKVYGADWEKVRHEMVRVITADRTESSKELSAVEADDLINVLDLEQLGLEVYGEGWMAKRGQLCMGVSKNESNDPLQLTRKQVVTLLDGIRKKQSVPSGK